MADSKTTAPAWPCSAATASRSRAPTAPTPRRPTRTCSPPRSTGWSTASTWRASGWARSIGGAVLKHSRDFNLMRECVLGSALSSVHPGVRPAAGLRHRPAGGDRRRRRHRRRPLRGRPPRAAWTPPPTRRSRFGDDLRRILLGLRRAKSNVDRLKLVGKLPADARRRDPGQQRAPHRAVDGRARRHHRQGDGHQARRPGRTGRRQPPQHGRRLRPRLLRRPGHPVPRALPRRQPAGRFVGGEAGQAASRCSA